MWTLYKYKFKKHFSAGNGEHGSKNRKSGSQGDDCIIEVPIGTVLRDKQIKSFLK